MTPVARAAAALRARLRALFRRGVLEREMREEMTAHLDQAAARLQRRGLSADAAREAARREFGNVAYLQEEARDVRGGRWVESLLGDVRFALRHFARTPLTAVTLVLVLALGIGVNSALFAILQALTMRPPPGIPAADALVRVRGSTLSRAEGRLEPREFSLPELNAIAAHRETFAAVAGFGWDQVVLDAGDGSDLRPISGYFVTPNFFATLGIRPAIGPGLPVRRTDDAPGSELAVVISHPLWEQLGGDTALIGRVVRLNDVPVRVAGVAPPRFYGVEMSDLRGFFMPLDARAAITRSTPHALASRDSALLQAVARLTPGTSVERATAVARVVAASWAPEVPRSGDVKEHSTDVVPLRGFTDVGSDGEALAIIALFGTGGLLVLLITCTNVSALLVGAGVARRREFAIRLSLGASRRRVIRQLVTETSIIALAGGALGLALYWWITRIVAWLVGDIGITPDLGTVAFTTAVALGTGIVFGLSPALHATRLDVATALKDASAGATSRTRLQRVFILAQIALTQPLLVGVAMVIGVTLLETGRGRDEPLADRLIRVEFGMEGGVGSRESKAERIREVMDRVAALPGVEGVVPQAAGLATGQLRVHASNRGGGPRAGEMVQVTIDGTAPGYFALQGIPMLRGRELMPTDTASGGDMAVVIDSDLARGFWGATDPIGKRMDVTSRQFADGPRTAVVVGVFDTARVTARGPDRVYTAAGAGWSKKAYLVRTQVEGTTVIPAIRQLARAEIPDIPIYNRGLLTLEQLTRIERNEILQISAGVSGGGALALLLASIGLYGVVALAVRQRQREIGIRVALGARPRQVVGMFLSSGVRLSAIGIALGLPLSVVAVRFLVLSLADMEKIPINMPLVGAAIAVVVIAVASLASWIPARKAARVDPILTLKTE